MDLNDFDFEELREKMRAEAVAAIDRFELEEIGRDELFDVGVQMAGVCDVSYTVIFLWLMRSYPEDTAVMTSAGVGLQKLNDHHSAANVFEDLCDRMPDNCFAHIGYAESLIELRYFEEAQESIDAVLKLEPDAELFMQISALHQRKSVLLSEGKQTAEAVSAYEDALYYAQQAVKKGGEEADAEQESSKTAAEIWLEHLQKNPPGEGGETMTLNM